MRIEKKNTKIYFDAARAVKKLHDKLIYINRKEIYGYITLTFVTQKWALVID